MAFIWPRQILWEASKDFKKVPRWSETMKTLIIEATWLWKQGKCLCCFIVLDLLSSVCQRLVIYCTFSQYYLFWSLKYCVSKKGLTTGGTGDIYMHHLMQKEIWFISGENSSSCLSPWLVLMRLTLSSRMSGGPVYISIINFGFLPCLWVLSIISLTYPWQQRDYIYLSDSLWYSRQTR